MDIHIIDDDKNQCRLFFDIAQYLNYSSTAFSDPDEYLAYMGCGKYSPPNLTILSDVDMPIMSGYELMDIVRKSYPDQRFVIITGQAKHIPQKNEFACFYLCKPVPLDKLKRVLKTQTLCIESGASPERLGCVLIDDRRDFCIKDWHCPLSVER